MTGNDKRNLQRGDREQDHYNGKYPENSQYGLRNSEEDGHGEERDDTVRPSVPGTESPAEGLGRTEGGPTPAKPRKEGG